MLARLQKRLLVEHELGRHEVRVGLACGRLEGPEVATVDLVALHQTDVREIRRDDLNGVDHVGQHGEVGRYEFGPGRAVLVCRVEDVRGGPDDPFTPAEIDEKFDECFRRGARPLDSAQIALLTQRVREVEAQSDMAAFFDGIC